MAEIRRSPQAEADLTAILADLDQKNPRVADRYAAAFAEKADVLARFPEMGLSCPEIAADLRSTLVQPYVIFYRIAGDELQIIRILHSRMDLRSAMRAENQP
jgi:toxin ParE1/3/4